MAATEWCRACRALHDTVSVAVEIGPATLRDRLAALDRLVRMAPFAILANYNAIEEGYLSKATEDRTAEIEGGDLGWHAMPVGGPNTLRKMAVEIRAVDGLLASVDTRYNRIPPDPATAWRTNDGSAFVIPSRRRRYMGSRDGNDLSYGRRGTLMHRVIPAILAGMPVRPLTLEALDARADRSGVVLGAGLSPDATLRRAVPLSTASGCATPKFGMPSQIRPLAWTPRREQTSVEAPATSDPEPNFRFVQPIQAQFSRLQPLAIRNERCALTIDMRRGRTPGLAESKPNDD